MPEKLDKTPLHEMFNILFEESPDAVFLYDLEGNYQEGNLETERIVGYTKEELLGKSFMELNIIPESELPKAIQTLQENVKGKSTGPNEFTLIKKDGQKVIVEMRTYPFTFHDQLLIMGVARNITEKKKTEEKLQASENKYHSIFETSSDGIIVYSIKLGKIIDVNQKLCNLLKLTKEEIKTRSIEDSNKNITNFPYEITAKWIQKIAKDGPQIFELQVINKENEKIWVEVNLKLLEINNEEVVLAIIKNINERKLMENKLNALHQHSITLGHATTVKEISRKSLNLIKNVLGFTYTSFQLVEGKYLATIEYFDDAHPDGGDPNKYLRLPIDGKGLTTKVVREKKPILVNDVTNDPYFFEGNIGYSLSELAVPITLDNNVIGVLNVESHRKNAFTLDDQHLLEILANHIASALERVHRIESLEEMVEERTKEIYEIEKKYQEIIDVTGNQAFELDFKTNKIWVSGSVIMPEHGKQFTVDLEEYLSYQADMIDERDWDRVSREVNLAINGKRAFNTEYRVKNPDNDVQWYKVNSSLYLDEEGNPVKLLGISVNITEIKKMQEQLERQNIVLKELDDMKNRFISTISHELRTPITSFKGYLEIINDRTEYLPDDVRNYIEILERNADRLITLTNDLLDQQRIQTGRLQITTKKVDITKIVIDAVNEIKVLTDIKDIKIETNIQDDVPLIEADPVRIQQILVNLLHNAYKFSPEKTEIKVLIKHYQDYIHVIVSDEGIGLSEKQLSLLFKPFPGIEHNMNVVGTGLGLSICKGLIELHSGKIWAESDGIGKGSSFHFTLPVGN